MSEQPVIDPGRQKVLSLAAETRFAPNGIVSRTLLRTPNSRMLSGECEFSLAGQPYALKAGDLLHMPPNLPHAVKATQQFSMLLTLSKPEELPAPAVTPIRD